MKQYQKFELIYHGKEPQGSQAQIDLQAEFTCGGETKTVSGFYAGDGRYIVRYLPQKTGKVTWRVSGLFADEGEEICEACADGIHHGLVKPAGVHLQFEDGTGCRPFGTTVYAMMHQPKERIEQTIETLLSSPFNKVRTCVFPKHYLYNENEPDLFAFEKKPEGGFNFHRPCFAFWDAFEEMLAVTEEHGIQIDLIIFHPYDHWGFSHMTREQYVPYLHYLVARFSAFSNIWWSLANEYDCLKDFKKEDWDFIDQMISREDVYGHMLSAHHMLAMYDFSKPNITHCSLQGDAQTVEELQKRFHKPVLIDECGYEGNIFCHWGHLSAFEMMDRLWHCVVMGGYGTHGETFVDPEDVLWWSKGGKLHGQSPARIAFLKGIIDELPGGLEPVPPNFITPEEFKLVKEGKKEVGDSDLIRALLNLPLEEAVRNIENLIRDTRYYTGHCGEDAYLAYYGRHCTSTAELFLPENGKYNVDILDTWEMTRTRQLTDVNGTVTLSLPGKEGMAAIAIRVED